MKKINEIFYDMEDKKMWSNRSERKKRYLAMLDELNFAGGFTSEIVLGREGDRIELRDINDIMCYAIRIIEEYRPNYYEIYKNSENDSLNLDIHFYKKFYDQTPRQKGLHVGKWLNEEADRVEK